MRIKKALFGYLEPPEFFLFYSIYVIIPPMNTLVILAGGKSSRMGTDKVFLPLQNGESFLAHLYRNAKAVFDRVLISAGSSAHTDQIRALFPEAEIIPDRYPEQGPMGGIVSVYEECHPEKFAVIPADVPFADMDALALLYDLCGDDACVYSAEEDRPEPLIAAYGTTALEKLSAMRKEGRYRIRDAFSERTKFFSAGDLCMHLRGKEETALRNAFCNINTTEDYRKHIT